MAICNKFILIIIIIAFICPFSLATEYGGISKNDSDVIDYTVVDKGMLLNSADECFNNYWSETNTELKKGYLQKASANYYILTKADKKNIYPVVQLARVYDLSKNDKYAKSYFFNALGIDPKNVRANYYFGDFYYKRNDYKKALKYYNKAFEYGMSQNFENMQKMAIIYEKLGDLNKANLYYKNAILANPEDEKLFDKVREIENVKYKNTGYYSKKSK